MTEPAGRDVLVVGAGIVGVCCASYLQREGFRVTMIDRGAPGEGCSFGNAGGFGTGLVAPIATPGLFLRLPRMLLDPRQPLNIAPANLPRLLPWFLCFVKSARRRRAEAIARARASLASRVFDAYAPLLAAAGAESLVRREGALVVFESRASLAKATYGLDVARRHGVRVEELSGAEARDREPALGPVVACAVLFPDNGHTVNPLRLVTTLSQRFVADGGSLLRESVTGIALDGGMPSVVTGVATHRADAVVLAAGAWSKPFAAGFGARVLVEAERGYHAMLPDPGVALRAPVTISDRNIVVTPMEHGIRVTGIAEFASIDAPPNYGLADMVARQARDFLPGLGTAGASRWMGPRPSTPDSLPVIGPAPGHPAVHFAFGHGHMGLAWAAITGRLIADMVAGRPPSLDCTPFRADRF